MLENGIMRVCSRASHLSLRVGGVGPDGEEEHQKPEQVDAGEEGDAAEAAEIGIGEPAAF